MWFTIIISFVSGILFILLIEIICIYQWWIRKSTEQPSHRVNRPKVKNPEELTKLLKRFTELPEEDVKEQLRSPETCTCLNLIFAFLWREWRDSPQMKRLIISKLNREFNDLIGSKAAKGYIEEINIKSYSLGAALPIIKDIRLIGIKSQSAGHVPDEIDLALNISYSGGFYVSADFALALIKKSLYLSIKVIEISGRVKLSFRRNPVSHWSFSFFEEPEPKIELDAESRFEGKNIQQLTSLILRHFKKVIRRRYILPNYVIRYKPFLTEKVPQDEQRGIYIHNWQVTVGTAVVKIISCSRLPLQKKSAPGNVLFCSLFVDSIPFAERKNVDPSLWPVNECEMLRGGERKIGLTFHEVPSTEGDGTQMKIVVDSIDPESPAGYSSLKEGDIILEINGKNVTDAKDVAKLIKTSSRRLSLVVKRPPSYMPISKTKELSQKIEIGAPLSEMSAANYDDEGSSDDEFIDIVKPLIQMSSSQHEASKGNKDISSFEYNVPLRHDFDKGSGKNDDDANSSPIPVRKLDKNVENEELLYSDDAEKPVNTFERKTTYVKASKNPQWDQEFELTIEKEHKYLNVLVWYRTRLESVKDEENEEQQTTKDILLGYVTIPLTDIAVRCLETGDRYNQQEYVLVSTAYDKVLASRTLLNGHPGLNRATCGGDITLAFIYKPLFDNDESPVKTKVHTSEPTEKDCTHGEYIDNADTADFDVRKHNFVDTQFYHPTKCEFCGKKIWRKSAYRCRLCGMACHKKCLQRAQTYTQCISQADAIPKEEEIDDGSDTETHPDVQVDVKTLKEHGINPFEIGPLENMSSAINKVKRVGRELYPELSQTNRKIKLEEMINKLQSEIDEENENRVKLYGMKKQSKSLNSNSKLEQLIIKSEQKSESLKLLMLQFCSGLVTCDSEM